MSNQFHTSIEVFTKMLLFKNKTHVYSRNWSQWHILSSNMFRYFPLKIESSLNWEQDLRNSPLALFVSDFVRDSCSSWLKKTKRSSKRNLSQKKKKGDEGNTVYYIQRKRRRGRWQNKIYMNNPLFCILMKWDIASWGGFFKNFRSLIAQL